MVGRERDEKSGKFTEEYPPDVFIEALEEISPAGTTDVADKVGCDRRTAYLKLQKLKEDGAVQSQKVGNALLWNLSD